MATYYINAGTGNDTTGNGTSGTPWATLSKAVASSAAGDTIVCQTTTTVYAMANLTISGRTIQGQANDGSGAIFDGANGSYSWSLTGNTTIEKIRLYRVTAPAAGIISTSSFSGSPTITLNNVHFKQCKATGGGAYGLVGGEVSAGETHTYLFNNCLFENCEANTVSGTAQRLFSNAGTSSTTVVRTFTNCVFIWNSITYTPAIFSQSSVSVCTNTLKNCILYNNSGMTIDRTGITGSLDTYPTTYSDVYGTFTGALTGTGTITSDPLFVDAPNSNFNLRQTSPCVGTGTT